MAQTDINLVFTVLGLVLFGLWFGLHLPFLRYKKSYIFYNYEDLSPLDVLIFIYMSIYIFVFFMLSFFHPIWWQTISFACWNVFLWGGFFWLGVSRISVLDFKLRISRIEKIEHLPEHLQNIQKEAIELVRKYDALDPLNQNKVVKITLQTLNRLEEPLMDWVKLQKINEKEKKFQEAIEREKAERAKQEQKEKERHQELRDFYQTISQVKR